jgi:hypothetical protein
MRDQFILSSITKYTYSYQMVTVFFKLNILKNMAVYSVFNGDDTVCRLTARLLF